MNPDRFRAIRAHRRPGAVRGGGLHGIPSCSPSPTTGSRTRSSPWPPRQTWTWRWASTGPHPRASGWPSRTSPCAPGRSPGKKASLIPIERGPHRALAAGPAAGRVRLQPRAGRPGRPHRGRREGREDARAHEDRDRELAMAQMPGSQGARSTCRWPGALDLALDLATPNHRNGEASGSLNWTCDGAWRSATARRS